MTTRWLRFGSTWRQTMRGRAGAERAARLHVVELAELERLAARHAAEAHPAGDAERDAHLHAGRGRAP